MGELGVAACLRDANWLVESVPFLSKTHVIVRSRTAPPFSRFALENTDGSTSLIKIAAVNQIARQCAMHKKLILEDAYEDAEDIFIVNQDIPESSTKIQELTKEATTKKADHSKNLQAEAAKTQPARKKSTRRQRTSTSEDHTI